MCSAFDPGERLTGGHLTDSVTRRGDRLERTPGPNAELIHQVLRHLANRLPGVAPVPLDLDVSASRETLSYLEGQVLSGGAAPDFLWTRSTLRAVAVLVRRMHDATADFVSGRLPASWRSSAPSDWPIEVICHNDIAPWNTVFSNTEPTALIDWDTAAPGPRLWDVAYALWHFVPLYGDPRTDPFDTSSLEPRGVRCREFCDAYGLENREHAIDAVVLRQRAVLDEFRTRSAAGEPAYVRLWESGAGAGIQRQIDFVTRNHDELCAALRQAA